MLLTTSKYNKCVENKMKMGLYLFRTKFSDGFEAYFAGGPKVLILEEIEDSNKNNFHGEMISCEGVTNESYINGVYVEDACLSA